VVPVRNVYYLLCYAWDHAESAPLVDVGGLEAGRLQDLLAHVLVSGVAGLLRRGLDRAYVEHEDALRSPRGRLDVSATLKRNLERASRAVCQFDELSHDVLHNRLLRATMLRLAAAGIAPRLARELTLAARRMREVADIDPVPALFRRVQLHRNNAHYRFLLHVCELAVKFLIPEQQGQGFRFIDFRVDEQEMGALFEAFVRNFLRREQGHFSVGGEIIRWAAEPVQPGAEALLPIMRTDISLVAPGHKVILDAKFYTRPLRTGRDGSKKLREEHLYQMFAYLKNLEARGHGVADTAVLLYATSGERFDHRFRLGAHQLRARSLDLNQPWSGIREELLLLAHSLRREV
jgi:5-methylcytosine-specific restriction enzyme subunit McrC